MTDRTARVRKFHLYRQYFGLVAAAPRRSRCGSSIRTSTTSLRGDTIRFRIKGTEETCDVNVLRVTEDPHFEALLGGEVSKNVNRTAGRDQQLADIRSIYDPEKEALGTIAIQIERALYGSKRALTNSSPSASFS
jgi:hypothetical protein